MGISAILQSPSPTVTPGVPLDLVLTVRNDTTVVQSYGITPVGVAAPHLTAVPSRLSVYPGRSESATITLSLPRTPESVAGELATGVRVVATTAGVSAVPAVSDAPRGTDASTHPAVAVADAYAEAETAEVVLQVEPFVAIDADLVPRVSRSRGRRRVRLAVDNNGNAPVLVQIVPEDNRGLTFAVRDPEVWIDPGRAQFVGITLIPRRRIWRGASVGHPYSLIVEPSTGEAVEQDGSHLQEAVFPPWFWKAVLALLALIALLVLLWNLLLKPTVEDAARDAVREPLAQIAEQAASADQSAAAAEEAAEQAAAAAEGADGSPPPTPTTPAPASERTWRTGITVNPGSTVDVEVAPAPDSGASTRITDIVLNNPQGDVSTVALTANGTTIMSFSTENYRDLDLHFITPVDAGGAPIVATMTCILPGAPVGRTPATCSAHLLLTGFVATPEG